MLWLRPDSGLPRSAPQYRLASMYFCSVGTSGNALQWMKVHMNIMNMEETVFLNTDALTSIARHPLHAKLEERRFPLETKFMQIRTSKGFPKNQAVTVYMIPVNLAGRKYTTDLVVFPGSRDKKNLLGTDFMEVMGIVLNAPQRSCYFYGSDQAPIIQQVQVIGAKAKEEIAAAEICGRNSHPRANGYPGCIIRRGFWCYGLHTGIYPENQTRVPSAENQLSGMSTPGGGRKVVDSSPHGDGETCRGDR